MVDSMEVVGYGAPTVSGIHDDFSVPVSYKLEREDYIIYAATDLSRNVPHVVLSVEGKGEQTRSFDVRGIPCVLAPRPLADFEVSRGNFRPDGVQLIWVARVAQEQPPLPGCRGTTIPPEQDRAIVVSIFGENGVIARESLAFRVTTYGKRTVIDGI